MVLHLLIVAFSLICTLYINMDIFLKILWTFSQPAGNKTGRTLRNRGTVYYCALLRGCVQGLTCCDDPGPMAEWTFCSRTALWAGHRLAFSPEDTKDDRRMGKQRKRHSPPWSFWHSQSPPTTVIIGQREAVCAFRYSGEECDSGKSVGVSWQESCCSTTLHLIPVAQLHLAKYADHVNGRLPLPRGRAVPARVYC